MRWFDRLTIAVLSALLVWLVISLAVLGDRVADIDDRPIPTTIVEEPTTAPPPVVCVVGGDTNWAARFGVEDRSCT